MLETADASAHLQHSSDLGQLVEMARAAGWELALHQHQRAMLQRGEPAEDRRLADGLYLVDIRPDHTALVLGTGLGALPVALAERCGRVCAVDPHPSRVAFLAIRKEQQGLHHLEPVLCPQQFTLPAADATVDVAVLGWLDGWPRDWSLPLVLREFTRILKPGGSLYLTVGNRWNLLGLLHASSRSAPAPALTLPGYRRLLRRCGFPSGRFFAPLPRHGDVPLVLLPLAAPGIRHFFFDYVFGLLDMVSPEAKRAYAREYAIVRAGVGLARALGLTRLLPYVVPGYCIIAQKGGGGDQVAA